MEMYQSGFLSQEAMESVERVRNYVKTHPKTCFFLAVLLFTSCLPLAIFLTIVVGAFCFLMTVVMVIQGAIIGVCLTTLLVVLPGPLVFAVSCTAVVYILQKIWARLLPMCQDATQELRSQISKVTSAVMPGYRSADATELVDDVWPNNNTDISSDVEVDGESVDETT